MLGGPSVCPNKEKFMSSTLNNLNISTKFKNTLKWKNFQVNKWIDTAGETQTPCITFKWYLVVCFHVIGIELFARYQMILMSIIIIC